MITDGCLHVLTVPSEWPRWRRCMECNELVHRAATSHYRELFIPPKPVPTWAVDSARNMARR